jgi:hypothetical protein
MLDDEILLSIKRVYIVHTLKRRCQMECAAEDSEPPHTEPCSPVPVAGFQVGTYGNKIGIIATLN